MAVGSEQHRELQEFARHVVEALQVVAHAASAELARRARNTGDVFAGPVGTAALMHVQRAQSDARAALQQLRREPFVARVRVNDANESTRVLYFCRSEPRLRTPELAGQLVPYRSSAGAIAEYPPGSGVVARLPYETLHQQFRVLERAQLRPAYEHGTWDAKNCEFEGSTLRVSVESALHLLQRIAEAEAAEPEDFIGRILAEAALREAAREGIRRQVISHMGLRDQPVLDRIQGEIFRERLDRQLMLSGPPGTGKTTTLIRRLAQKRNVDELDDEERALFPEDRHPELFHENNWVMFSPTELLKLYIKEAFAREGVAATDQRVRTWSDERRRLARNVFSVLRSESRGLFTLSDDVEVLSDTSSTSLVGYCGAFQEYVEHELSTRYTAEVDALTAVSDEAIRGIATRLKTAFGSGQIGFRRTFNFIDEEPLLKDHATRLAFATGDAINGILNRMLQAKPDLLESVADAVGAEVSAAEDDNDDESDLIDEDQNASVVVDRAKLAIRALQAAVASFARQAHARSSHTAGTRTQLILDHIADVLPAPAAVRNLGEQLLALPHLRFLANTVRNLVDSIPSIYGRFRRACLRDGRWLGEGARTAVTRKQISGHEVDVVLRTMLQHARHLLVRNQRRLLRDASLRGTLSSVREEYVTQVLVDEATDFSPVQLACMLELAHPEIRSFFLSGDVRQRVTQWGVQHVDELKWVAEDFQVREIDVGYRQSPELSQLAAAVAALRGGSTPRVRQPDREPGSPITPRLVEHLSGDVLAEWLTARLSDIERSLGRLPSVAIFVVGDQRVDPLVDALRPRLSERNLKVVACKEGRIVGTENEIRVFDVHHIKGLEFEAVFYAGIDLLVEDAPELFDKYLYVGVTRAATYLGLSCEGALPPTLDPLRGYFGSGAWE